MEQVGLGKKWEQSERGRGLLLFYFSFISLRVGKGRRDPPFYNSEAAATVTKGNEKGKKSANHSLYLRSPEKNRQRKRRQSRERSRQGGEEQFSKLKPLFLLPPLFSLSPLLSFHFGFISFYCMGDGSLGGEGKNFMCFYNRLSLSIHSAEGENRKYFDCSSALVVADTRPQPTKRIRRRRSSNQFPVFSSFIFTLLFSVAEGD